MFIRQYFKEENGQRTAYWALVESYRTRRGPRQRVFAWLALHLIRMLQLDTFLQKAIPAGREQVPWDVSSLILIIARLLNPSSELYIAEQWYPKMALSDLLGVLANQVDGSRNWATLSAGCYLLRTNVSGWSDEELWKACIQLTEAEAAFRSVTIAFSNAQRLR